MRSPALNEWEAHLIIEGVQSGGLDAADIYGLVVDPAAWIAESETYTARRIRNGRDAGHGRIGSEQEA